jgi:hypothetical protein
MKIFSLHWYSNIKKIHLVTDYTVLDWKTEDNLYAFDEVTCNLSYTAKHVPQKWSIYEIRENIKDKYEDTHTHGESHFSP